MPVPRVLLVTCALLPEGEPGHPHLDRALAERGVEAAWVSWDDPDVDWAGADLVAVRSTWDYEDRLDDFLAWADRVGPALLHGPDVLRWNTDKSYLLELAARGVAIVPTERADDEAEVRAAVARHAPAVVKPRVGAGGRGLSVVADAGAWVADDLGPWIVQPLVGSVHVEGERSVFVLDGHPAGQVRKVAGPGDVRVHEEHGGSSYGVEPDGDLDALALAVVTTAQDLLGADLAYARVDLMWHDGRWVVGELEVTEPGLYLDVLPAVAPRFADLVVARLRSAGHM